MTASPGSSGSARSISPPGEVLSECAPVLARRDLLGLDEDVAGVFVLAGEQRALGLGEERTDVRVGRVRGGREEEREEDQNRPLQRSIPPPGAGTKVGAGWSITRTTTPPARKSADPSAVP